jgi:hypothetical protein
MGRLAQERQKIAGRLEETASRPCTHNAQKRPFLAAKQTWPEKTAIFANDPQGHQPTSAIAGFAPTKVLI